MRDWRPPRGPRRQADADCARSRRRRVAALLKSTDAIELLSLSALPCFRALLPRHRAAEMRQLLLTELPDEVLRCVIDFIATGVDFAAKPAKDPSAGTEGAVIPAGGAADASDGAGSAVGVAARAKALLRAAADAKARTLGGLQGVLGFAMSCTRLRALVDAIDARWWAERLRPFDLGIPAHLTGACFVRRLLAHHPCTEKTCRLGSSRAFGSKQLTLAAWPIVKMCTPNPEILLEPTLSDHEPSFYMHDLHSASHAAWADPDVTAYSPIGMAGRLGLGRGVVMLDGRGRLHEDFVQLAGARERGAPQEASAPLHHPLAFTAHIIAQATLVTRPRSAKLSVTLPPPDDALKHTTDLVFTVDNPSGGITIIDLLNGVVDKCVLGARPPASS